MIKSILTLFSTFVLSSNVFSQTLLYDVIVRDEVIGQMIAEKTQAEPQSTRYYLYSNFSKSFIINWKFHFEMKCVYNNNYLDHSLIERYMNDKLKDRVEIDLRSEDYLWSNNRGESAVLGDKEIKYSSVLLYFNEPKNYDRIFSEQYAQYLKLQKSENEYLVYLPNGDVNQYAYENGFCSKAIINGGLATFTLRLNKVMR